MNRSFRRKTYWKGASERASDIIMPAIRQTYGNEELYLAPVCIIPPPPPHYWRVFTTYHEGTFPYETEVLSCSNAHLILTHLDLHLWDV